MRTIKFRAWDEGKKIMIEDVGIFGGRAVDSASRMYDTPNMEIESLDAIPMQFTGLLDKNGKEIYEGDILGTWGKAVWPVAFVEGHFCFIYEDERKAFGLNKSALKGKEIIGNVYENPELLK